MNKIKTFVLDTNILLDDPATLTNFADNNVVIPMTVLEELDSKKRLQDELGRNAREAQRRMDEIFPTQDSINLGYKKPAGGTVKIVKMEKDGKAFKDIQAILPDMDKADNRILAVALQVKLLNNTGTTVMVSRDVNVRIKAKSLGLEAEDLHRDKVDAKDVTMEAYPRYKVSGYNLQELQSKKSIELEGVPASLDKGYMFLSNEEVEGKEIPVKHLGNGKFRTLIYAPGAIPIAGGQTFVPRNTEQKFLLDALLDDSVHLVTVTGKAGTGKTLEAIAAGISQMQRGKFNKLMITRAIVPMGNDIGFLPGTMEEKMQPWMQPCYDAVEVLMNPKSNVPEHIKHKPQSERKKEKGQNGNGQGAAMAKVPLKPHEKLMAAGVLEIQPLAQIRGRSIPKAFMIVDECQNTSKLEAKTIVTRMAEGSKVILIGDPAQIDHPYLDSLDNGLVYVQSKMKNDDLHVHVEMFKGERSALAEAAANKL